MNFAREGLSFIAIAALVAVGAFGVALMRRSWPLWLVAFGLTVIALSALGASWLLSLARRRDARA